jgi:putative N6-adenine-specific DNA methylase
MPRVKKTEPMQLIATTLSGLEDVLLRELESLGATEPVALRRAVSFQGDMDLLYRANYTLRTALRVLHPIREFEANREQDLYRGVQEIDWQEHLDKKGSLAIDPVVTGEVFRHGQYAAQLTKDAIVDQFRDRTGRRPDVNLDAPHLRINLRIHQNKVVVSLDSSGESLHKRGYRKDSVAAPLNEVLAAGMVSLSGWEKDSPFADPMCGSGTLSIEAAMMATRKPVQHGRERFGFEHWPSHDAKRWALIRQEADALMQPFPFPIRASDQDARARNATAINLMASDLEKVVQLHRMAFEKVVPPEPPGTLILNPPYDERMPLEDAITWYKSLGDHIKHHWKGWNTWIISGHREALKHIGLKTKQKIPLLNGAITCGYHGFDVY